jgi:Nucleotidyl transferase
VRQYSWMLRDVKNRQMEDIIILSGDHLYRMDYMKFVDYHRQSNADVTIGCAPMQLRARAARSDTARARGLMHGVPCCCGRYPGMHAAARLHVCLPACVICSDIVIETPMMNIFAALQVPAV